MENLKSEILFLVEKYYIKKAAENKFVPGETNVPVSGKFFDSEEIKNIVESALDGWFTTGRFNNQFQNELKKFIGIKYLLTTNSGSSANLLATAALTSDELGSRKLNPEDEVITVAASFPTTINPMLLYGLKPVFVDVKLPTYNIDVSQIENVITQKTKAIIIAHTLGNPFELDAVKNICEKHSLWLLEDCCDALGATYNGKHVGTFGDIGTLSFYPAHHITTGEGGAVFTNNPKLKKIMESLRDWGRDCWCEPGHDNTCGKRFDWKLGNLPSGYDHKYVYSRLGFNLKMTDMQAALGLAQLKKLDGFIEKRRKYFNLLYEGLKKYTDKIILPEATNNSNPSWFGFLITIKPEANINREELLVKLNNNKIGTRLLFAGDIRKQPYFKNISYSSSVEMQNTELILNNTFWIGVAPLLSEKMIEYIINVFDNLLPNNDT